MMLLTNRTAATRRYIASMILRCGPSAAALGYPLALVLLHQSGRQFVQATDATGTLLAGFAVCITVTLVYSVPVLSFVIILQSAGQIRMRRLAHLAFSAPPLFTVIGVVFFFLGIPNGDYVVWAVAWLGVLAYAASASPEETAPAPPATWVRTAHGVTGATILAIYLVWHLANHALAMFSPDANKRQCCCCGPGIAPVSCSRSCSHCSYGNWRLERVCCGRRLRRRAMSIHRSRPPPPDICSSTFPLT
jgi:hypothetical protein